jgi:hypothetical protein
VKTSHSKMRFVHTAVAEGPLFEGAKGSLGSPAPSSGRFQGRLAVWMMVLALDREA